jgi:hypothetical protein
VVHEALAVEHAQHLESASVAVRSDGAQVAEATGALAIMQLQGRTVGLGAALEQQRAAGRQLIYTQDGQKYLMSELGPGRWVRNSRVDARVVQLTC